MKPKRNKARSFENAAKIYNYEFVDSETCNPPPPTGVEDMREEDIYAWKDEVAVKTEPEALSTGEELEDHPTPRPSRYVRRRVPRADRVQLEAADDRKSDGSVTEHEAGCSVKGKEHNFNEEEPAEGCAFLWCLDCERVDRVRYGNRTLPKYVKGEENESEFGMVLVLCGTCRHTLVRITQGKAQLESSMASSFNNLRLRPRMFEGSKAVQAVREAMGREIEMFTDKEGVAYRDLDRIVKGLGTEDQIASVDVEKFRGGGREKLILPYVRGGLVSL
jgi:hypothetical protein